LRNLQLSAIPFSENNHGRPAEYFRRTHRLVYLQDARTVWYPRTGFTEADTATRLAPIDGKTVRAVGGKFDLSGLNGVTLAVDYSRALLDVDRGYETNYKLNATKTL